MHMHRSKYCWKAIHCDGLLLSSKWRRLRFNIKILIKCEIENFELAFVSPLMDSNLAEIIWICYQQTCVAISSPGECISSYFISFLSFACHVSCHKFFIKFYEFCCSQIGMVRRSVCFEFHNLICLLKTAATSKCSNTFSSWLKHWFDRPPIDCITVMRLCCWFHMKMSMVIFALLLNTFLSIR